MLIFNVTIKYQSHSVSMYSYIDHYTDIFPERYADFQLRQAMEKGELDMLEEKFRRV